MKKIGLLLSVVALLLATSCTDKQAYTINGKVANTELNGKQVYLQELNADGQGFTAIDTAIVENGAFVFSGKASDTLSIRFISIAEVDYLRPALLILEAGKIAINIDTVPTVGGSPSNDKYQEFATKSKSINDKMKALGNEFNQASENGTMTPELDEKINKDYDEKSEELAKLAFDYTKSNIATPVGEFFFMSLGSSFSEEQVKELLPLASAKFKETEPIKKLITHFELLEATAVGKQFIDVKGKTPDGKDIALSDYAGKGQVVLIDFWASWCGPCIKEMPSVVEAYKLYKAKGFEIVGISLDKDGDKWLKATKDLGMTWPQMSDLKGWESDLSAPYGVRSIPFTVLLDKEGKIIEKNLKGKDLLNKLEELLK